MRFNLKRIGRLRWVGLIGSIVRRRWVVGVGVESVSIAVRYCYRPKWLHLLLIFKDNIDHCLKETLYPPPAPCYILKLSKLSPKYPNTLFPIFLSPSITSFFCFSFFYSIAFSNSFILIAILTSPGFISNNFLFWVKASSKFYAFSL